MTFHKSDQPPPVADMQNHITAVLLQHLHHISLTNADFERTGRSFTKRVIPLLLISPFFCLCQWILILIGL